MLEQGLSGFHAAEDDRFHGQFAVAVAAIGRLLERTGFGKIAPIVRAARVAPRQRRERDDFADLRETDEVQPVVPRQVEGALTVRQRAARELVADGAEL